jgi:hypothetical protein
MPCFLLHRLASRSVESGLFSVGSMYRDISQHNFKLITTTKLENEYLA